MSARVVAPVTLGAPHQAASHRSTDLLLAGSLVLAAGAVVGLAGTENGFGGLLLAIAVYVVGLVITTVTARATDRPALYRVFTLGYAARLAYAMITWHVVYAWKETPFLLLDEIRHDWLGEWIASDWRSGQTPSGYAVTIPNPGLNYLTAAIYYVLGSDTLFFRIINCGLGAMMGVALYWATVKVFERPIALRAAWLTAMLPELVFWSGLHIKDVLVSLLIVLAMGVAFNVARGNYASALWLLPILGMLLYLRKESVLVLGAAIGCHWMLQYRRQSGSTVIVRSSIIFILAMVSIGILSQTQQFQQMLESYTSDGLSRVQSMMLGEIDKQTDSESLSSVFLIAERGWMYHVAIAPLALVYVLVSPLPTFSADVSQVLNVGMLVWYALLPLIGIGIWRTWREKRSDSILLYLLIALPLLGILGSLLIQAFRYKVQFMPQMIVMAAYAMAHWRHRYSIVYFYYILLAAGAASLYIIVKLLR